MTLHVADIASYQGDLTAEALLTAGVAAVNVKTSHGVGTKAVHARAREWLADERFQRSTFHYLTVDAPGDEQAAYAYERLRALGALTGRPCAHVVDVEAAGLTAAHVTSYCSTMHNLLGRPIALYTGDWYWIGKGWVNGAGFAPWLWAVPNAGSMPYPGDDSAHWVAGYGGWDDLAVMQYAVIPIAGIRVSMSAVRDTVTWDAMRGVAVPWIVTSSLNNLLHEIDEVAPDRDKASDGSIGDQSHATGPSGHNPDETGTPEDYDADSVNEVRARDFDADLRRPGLTMEMIAQYLVQQCRTGRITWIKYIIFNRRIWSASGGWVERPYTGPNPHDKHMHVSSKPDTASENDTRPLGLASLIEETDMQLTDKIGDDRYPNRTLENFFGDMFSVRDQLVGDAKAPAATGPLKALLDMAADYGRLRGEVAKLTTAMAGERAEVPASPEAIAAAVRAMLDEMPEVVVNVTPEALETAIIGAVHKVTSSPAP